MPASITYFTGCWIYSDNCFYQGKQKSKIVALRDVFFSFRKLFALNNRTSLKYCHPAFVIGFHKIQIPNRFEFYGFFEVIRHTPKTDLMKN